MDAEQIIRKEIETWRKSWNIIRPSASFQAGVIEALRAVAEAFGLDQVADEITQGK